MRETKGSLKLILLRIAFYPMIIMTLITMIAGSYFVADSITLEVQEEMVAIGDTIIASFDFMYPGAYKYDEREDGIHFYKGEHEFNSDFSFIDSVKKRTGVDITVCYLNSAVITTLKDSQGNRLIGCSESEDILDKVVISKDTFFLDNAVLAGEKYFVYYCPLLDADSNGIGMLCINKPSSYVSNLVLKALLPLLLIGVIAIVLVSLLVLRYSEKLIMVIRKVQKYMGQVAEENFRAELDPLLLNRSDELGQMANSASIMSASLRKKVEEDLLTGLYNRRSADKKIKRTISNYVDKGVGFCLALGDIDFFKKVNDTYGHEAGDDVLEAVAYTLKNFMLGKGYAIRWGGEEFILVYEGYDLAKASLAMNEVMDEIRALLIVNNNNEIKVTMTFGLVESNPEDMKLKENFEKTNSDEGVINSAYKMKMDSYIASADLRLYYGKENGRNQLVNYDVT